MLITKIIISISSLVFSILLIEVVSYMIYRPSHLYNAYKIIQYDSDVFWSNRRNNETIFYNTKVRTNNIGLRHYKNKYHNDRYKILAMGASPTFGWGVQEFDTYSHILKEKLGHKYDVINGGMVGYSTFQGRVILEELLDRIEPNLLTISYVINDVDRIRFAYDSSLQDHQVSVSYSSLYNFIIKFKTYWLLKEMFHTTENISKGKNRSLISRTSRVSLSEYEQNIYAMIKIARKRNIEIILMVMPVNLKEASSKIKNTSYNKTYKKIAGMCYSDSLLYNNKMRLIGKKAALEVVDIASEMRKRGNINKFFLIVNNDTIHPNRTGHEIIAEMLFSRISEMRTENE